MTKYILLACSFYASNLLAQAPEDAARFSFIPQNGTARNVAIGGAMGSLGGDINATFVNPAGLGFYRTKEFVLTPGFNLNNNKADYRGNTNKNKSNAFNFGTSGFIIPHLNNWNDKSAALSIAITQTANFNNKVQYKGYNNFSSAAEMFAEELKYSGVSVGDALNTGSAVPYGAAPALYTYLIDTMNVGGVPRIIIAPQSILAQGQALEQSFTQKTSGGIYDIALGYGAEINKQWMFGGSFSLSILDYKSLSTLTEKDSSSNANNGFEQFTYTDDVSTNGLGGNLKLGVIYRPREYIRLGLAVHTPTLYFLNDKRETNLQTEVESPYLNTNVSSKLFTGNAIQSPKFNQNTPFRIIASGSYVFREVENVKKQRAFISADIEYVGYRGSRFSSAEENPTTQDEAYYKELNAVVKDYYKGNFNFRVGGELKFNIIMARLGFAYYGSPYKDKELKANRMILSGGLGYRHKGVFVDLTYAHQFNKDVNFAYRLADKANTFAQQRNQAGQIVATLGFKL